MSNFQSINIILGNLCNLSCDHCANSSGPNSRTSLSPLEIMNLITEINNNDFYTIMFTGGEPTLYLKAMNEILSEVDKSKFPKVSITTNGIFARSYQSVENTIGKIKYIHHIQLSIDSFHKNDVQESAIHYLAEYCRHNHIEFNITCTIYHPSELLRVKELMNGTDIPVIIQKVELTGRARDNNLQFENYKFDFSILKVSCPNKDIITYHQGKGFSVCCGNVAFNHNFTEIYSSSVTAHKNSPFYYFISNATVETFLSEMLIKTTNIPARLSSPCSACEYYHESFV